MLLGIRFLTRFVTILGVAVLCVAHTVEAFEVLDREALYTFLAKHKLPDLTTFTPPYPIGGVRLEVTDQRVNGTWITAAGADGPILVIENFQNGSMGVALLLPASVTGTPTWLYSLGPFGFTSIFGGTFYLGALSGAGLDGQDQIGLSWVSESELLFTFFQATWIGPPVSVEMRRLREAM